MQAKLTIEGRRRHKPRYKGLRMRENKKKRYQRKKIIEKKKTDLTIQNDSSVKTDKPEKYGMTHKIMKKSKRFSNHLDDREDGEIIQ